MYESFGWGGVWGLDLPKLLPNTGSPSFRRTDWPCALLTFDIFAIVGAAFAQSSEIDACRTFGRSAGIDHLESLKRGDQYLLLFREKGVTPDRGPEASPDTKEGVVAKSLCSSVLEGCRSKAPQSNSSSVPRWPEAQANHPPVHLPAPARSLARKQLQGLSEQEVEGLEGEVVEVVGPRATRLAHCGVEFLVQGAAGSVGKERHPVLFPEARGWRGQEGWAEAPR